MSQLDFKAFKQAGAKVCSFSYSPKKFLVVLSWGCEKETKNSIGVFDLIV
jgi:hypothetical protein